MKRAWFAAGILIFVSVAAGVAQTPAPSVAPLSAAALAAILNEPVDSACPKPQEEVVFAARKPSFLKVCSATATCNDTSGVNVSCNFTGSGGSCSFQNQNCDVGIRGHVNCNGAVTNCPQCPCGTPNCCNCLQTGDCFACCRCDGGTIGQCAQACGWF